MNRLHGISPEHIVKAVLDSRRRPDWEAVRDPEPGVATKAETRHSSKSGKKQ
jgi:hypothetical protein